MALALIGLLCAAILSGCTGTENPLQNNPPESPSDATNNALQQEPQNGNDANNEEPSENLPPTNPPEDTSENNESEEIPKNETDNNESGDDATNTQITTANISIHMINVGQGDSIFIQMPNGRVMLIDAGGNNKGSTVCNYVRSLGITTIDAVIATHPHADHIGGMDNVLYAFDVLSIYDSGLGAMTATYSDYMDAAKVEGCPIYVPAQSSFQSEYHFSVGDSIDIDSNVSIQIIHPDKSDYSNPNDASVSIRLVYGNFSFISCGDCESTGESEIVNSGLILSSTVLKVNHHGSKTSTSQSFLNSVNPKVALISAGENNKYKHPHDETLEKLKSIPVYITEGYSDSGKYSNVEYNCGSVVITSNGETWNPA